MSRQLGCSSSSTWVMESSNWDDWVGRWSSYWWVVWVTTSFWAILCSVEGWWWVFASIWVVVSSLGDAWVMISSIWDTLVNRWSFCKWIVGVTFSLDGQVVEWMWLLACWATEEQLMFALAQDATMWFTIVGAAERSWSCSKYGAANWWEVSWKIVN